MEYSVKVQESLKNLEKKTKKNCIPQLASYLEYKEFD